MKSDSCLQGVHSPNKQIRQEKKQQLKKFKSLRAVEKFKSLRAVEKTKI